MSPARLVAPPFDPCTAVTHLARRDPVLRRVIDRHGPCELRIDPTSSLFAYLARAIVYQQLNGRAAATIFSRVRRLVAPRRVLRPADVLALPDEHLRAAGLSATKASSLKDLARHAAAGELPTIAEAHRLSDEELVERLTVIRGIGPWTVHMFLMFRLGRPDVLPVSDYGVRKGFQLAYRMRDLPDAALLTARAERWRPYRSVGSWYMWRVLEA
ncbi:MAG: DNA-3-methyladenine glycosylase family protein [Gemmatimonadota bacterium]